MKINMSAMLWIALVLVPNGVKAQIPENQHSQGLLNCRFLNAQSEASRVAFLIGFSEAYKFFVENKDNPSPLPGSTYGELGKGITEICSRPENARIWIWSAILAFHEKLSGRSESDVEKILETARKIANEP